MKVKCIKIYNENTKQYQNSSSWLTIGKEYIVLAIEVFPDEVRYCLVGDNQDKSPGIYHASQFEVTSKKIPSNWNTHFGTLNLLSIEPKSWCEPGFWEDCYNQEPAALEIYKREARIIMEEENTL
jgi:hypothetical protein